MAEFDVVVASYMAQLCAATTWPLRLEAPSSFARAAAHVALQRFAAAHPARPLCWRRQRAWVPRIADADVCRRHPKAELWGAGCCDDVFCSAEGGCRGCGRTWGAGAGPIAREGADLGAAHRVVALVVDVGDARDAQWRNVAHAH